jgi:hypothetical protein
MRRPAVAVLVAVLALAGSTARATTRPTTIEVYGGVGSWLDIFAGNVWWQPNAVAASLAEHGVTTLYLQTGNYSQSSAVVRPRAVAALIDAAHAYGIDVVAWYLPSLTDVARDEQRALAAIRFRTQDGGRFDSFALDIEATLVRSVAARNARLLDLSADLRRAVGPAYPLGAIIPSPVGMIRHPHYWPEFPYAELARFYDAILPMAYFTHVTHAASAAYAYARDDVVMIRTLTHRPGVVIHLIGGLASGAPPAAFAAFDQAAADCGVAGLSLYEFPLTTAPEWEQLSVTTLGQTPLSVCD